MTIKEEFEEIKNLSPFITEEERLNRLRTLRKKLMKEITNAPKNSFCKNLFKGKYSCLFMN